MKVLKLMFYTKLFIYLICNSSTFADDHSTLQQSSDDSLSQLLQDRETRLKGYIVMGALSPMINIFDIISRSIYSPDVDVINENNPAPSLISITHNVFANNSRNYRREAYQLIRDLEIEILPNHHDYVPCIRNVYYYGTRTRYNIQGLVNIIHRLGDCLNLRYVDDSGNSVEEVDDEFETVSASQIGTNRFIYPTSSPSPIVQRVKRILNAILKLVAHVNDKEDFAVGKTEWYGEVSEDNYKKWKILANYVLVANDTPNNVSFVPTETDDDERFALLEERRLRYIQRKDDINNAQFNLYLEQINNVLDDMNLNKTPDASKITFPHLTLTDEESSRQLEMYELVKDLLVELGSTVYRKSSSLSVDFHGIQFVRQAFADDFKNIRDMEFKSTIYGELKLWKKLLNLTYVDSKNTHMLEPDNYTRGKYIFPFNSTEPLTSRHLRHIINGFERLYFDTNERRHFEPTSFGGIKNCTYEWIGNLTDDKFPPIIAEKSAYEDYLKYNRLPPLLHSLIRLIFTSSLDSLERFLTKLEEPDQLILIVEAKNYLINHNAKIRAKIYKHIGYLYIEAEDSNRQRYSDPRTQPKALNMTKTNVCEDNTTCQHVFLRLLQLTGKEFHLRYIDEYGEEIPIDSTLSSRFVGPSRDVWWVSQTKDAVKYHLNAIIQLLAEKNK